MTEIVGFTAGAFDLGPHAGHCALFEYAKKHCDHLIVGLHVNPQLERSQKNKPVPSLPERYFSLKALLNVDDIIPYETEADLILILQLLKPQKRFLGDDYKDKHFTGKDLFGIENIFCPRSHPCSSTRLREFVLQSAVDKITNLIEPQDEPAKKPRGRPRKKK